MVVTDEEQLLVYARRQDCGKSLKAAETDDDIIELYGASVPPYEMVVRFSATPGKEQGKKAEELRPATFGPARARRSATIEARQSAPGNTLGVR